MKAGLGAAFLWVSGLVVLPLLYVALLSLQGKGVYGGVEWTWSLANYQKIFEGPSLSILGKTFLLAFSTALVCSALGGLSAAFISRGSRQRRRLWMMLFLVPFFINSLIRLFSLQNFWGVEGPIQSAIRLFDPEFARTAWSHNSILMFVGMVLSYLPFAILPLVAAFEKWDFSLTEAAWDLGAREWTSFWKIKWPLLRPAFVASFAVVLIPALGEYLVPEILEGAKNLYWGQYITEAFLKWRNWPLGSALGLLLIGSLLGVLFISTRVQTWLQRKQS